MNPPFKDLTGRRFGRWEVIRFIGVKTFGKDNKRKRTWHCRCECGREALVIGSSLTSGQSKGCGCRRVAAQDLRLRTLFDLERILGKEMMASLMWDYVQKHLNLPAMKSLQSQLLAMEPEGIKEKPA